MEKGSAEFFGKPFYAPRVLLGENFWNVYSNEETQGNLERKLSGLEPFDHFEAQTSPRLSLLTQKF